MWDLWIKKCSGGSESLNWITLNTTNCPQCKRPVEKRGGCDHIHCQCKHHLCYRCGGSFGTAYSHRCAQVSQQSEAEKCAGKQKLEQYLNCYNRYEDHIVMPRRIKKLRQAVEDIGTKEDDDESRFRIKGELLRGLDSAIKARRVLSCTYAFAFFMFGDEMETNRGLKREAKELKRDLFEVQQRQLERHTDSLCTFLEQDVEILKLKKQIVNLSTIINKLCKEIYVCIEEELMPMVKEKVHIPACESKGVKRARLLSDSENAN